MSKESQNLSAFKVFKHYLTLDYQYAKSNDFKKFDYSLTSISNKTVEIKQNDINNAGKIYLKLQKLFFCTTSPENEKDKKHIVTICICLEKALEAANRKNDSTENKPDDIDSIKKQAQDRIRQFDEKNKSIIQGVRRCTHNLFYYYIPDKNDIDSHKIIGLIPLFDKHTKLLDLLFSLLNVQRHNIL
jgi:hypothetical protein